MKIGKVLIALGLVLLVLALAAVVAAQPLAQRADDRAAHLAAEVTRLLPPVSTGVIYPPAAPMPALETEGEDVVALLSIPAFSVNLPVGEGWNSWGTLAYPRRFDGTVADGTLVIGGTDRPAQLGCLDAVELGTAVTVTDMTGAVYSFVVERVIRSRTADASVLSNPDTHLTLFMRDTYSMEYVVVYCTAAV